MKYKDSNKKTMNILFRSLTQFIEQQIEMYIVIYHSYILYSNHLQLSLKNIRQNFMQIQTNDTLSLCKQIRLISQLQKQQKIIFSCDLLKYNDANKCQPRIFMLTDQAAYNVQKGENFIKSMMSYLVNFNKKFTVKRKITYQSIEAITLSNCQNNCQIVINVINQYAIRLRIDDKNVKKTLLKCLCRQYEKVTKKKMAFYFKDDITLAQYCTLKSDLKNKINKMPKQNRVYLNVQDLVDYEPPGTKFQPLYSYNGKMVDISKIVSSTLEKMKENVLYFSIQSKNAKFTDIEPYLQIKHQFVNLPYYIFGVQQNQNLYLLRPLMIGGKMDKFITSLGSLKKQICIFYISQIILVLEFLHAKGWVYRAASLSNIYIKQNGYIAIDGLNKLSKKKKKKDEVFYDICGLLQDLAPQMILCQGYNESIDIWGLGVCAYNMIQGQHPFIAYNAKETFRNILQKKVQQSEFLPAFVYRALQKDPALRPTLAQIKKDPCFAETNWQEIQKQLQVAPIIPELKSVFTWQGKLPSIVYLSQQKGKN